MNFRTNLSKLTLLGNEKVKIYFKDKTVEFNPPSIRLYLMDKDFETFYSLIKQTPEEFVQMVGKDVIIVKNKYEVILSILKLDLGVSSTLIDYFRLLFPNLEYAHSQLYCGGKPLTAEEYDKLLEILFVSCAERSLEECLGETGVKEVKAPVNDKQRELEEKIKAAKEKKNKKNKKEDTSSNKSSITIDQIVIGILYEFQSLKIDDIYSMNMFALLEIWKYVSKIVDNQIQIVAAGNGNVKKFTYFIN